LNPETANSHTTITTVGFLPSGQSERPPPRTKAAVGCERVFLSVETLEFLTATGKSDEVVPPVT